jgi:quercetin dioxygenase-like cupin family protein
MRRPQLSGRLVIKTIHETTQTAEGFALFRLISWIALRAGCQLAACHLKDLLARGSCATLWDAGFTNLAQPRSAKDDNSMEQRTVTHHRWNDIPLEPLSDVLSRKLITGDRMMLAHVYLKKGAVVPRHSHENEQITYILEGGLRFWIGADETQVIDVMAGEVLHIPSHVPHKAEALEDTLDVDIFSPPRQDWLDKTDDYLRQK